MRLWHKDLIPYLPHQQLVAQWRECCLIYKLVNEKGTPNHILVNYVVELPIEHFLAYSALVLEEFDRRGYNVRTSPLCDAIDLYMKASVYEQIYEQKYTDVPRSIDILPYHTIFRRYHTDIYLRECLYNLEEKYIRGGIPENEWIIIFNRFGDYVPLFPPRSLCMGNVMYS